MLRALANSLALFGLVLGAIAAPTATAEAAAARGLKIFAACAACHAADQPARTGPDLRGIFGRPAATARGFRYSRALKNAKLTWSEPELDRYLAEPQAAIPGNAMPFPGLPDEQQRRDVIAFLKTLQ